MRIEILCQNRIGLLRDILDLLLEYGVEIAHSEVGGEQGNAIYLACPTLADRQLQALTPRLEGVSGVLGVSRVELTPGERRHREFAALLGALDFPLLSVDGRGVIVATNQAAARLFGVSVDTLPGRPLAHYLDGIDLALLLGTEPVRLDGLQVGNERFRVDSVPLQPIRDGDGAQAGVVLSLRREEPAAERVGRRHRLAPGHAEGRRYGGKQGASALGDFSLEGSLGEIVGRFEKAVLQRLLGDYPSSRLLARRLGVSHTTIANRLRLHGLVRE